MGVRVSVGSMPSINSMLSALLMGMRSSMGSEVTVSMTRGEM